MREEWIDKYVNAQTTHCVHNTQTKTMSQNNSRDGENIHVLLQNLSVNCLCWTIKGQADSSIQSDE